MLANLYGLLLKEHKFWDTQPVRLITNNFAVEARQYLSLEEFPIVETPQEMVPGFRWKTLDLDNTSDMSRITHLLDMCYDESRPGKYQATFSPLFLKWQLQIPGYIRDFHIGVLDKRTGREKLVAMITGTPRTLMVNGKEQKMIVTNFLCIHPNLRKKSLGIMMINELKRRARNLGFIHGFHKSSSVQPTPFMSSRTYMKTLDVEKMYDTGFLTVPAGLTKEQMFCKHYYFEKSDCCLKAMPRMLQAKDMPQVLELYERHYRKYHVRFKMTEEELKQQLMPIDSTVVTLVYEDPLEHKITAFISVYNLP